MITYDENQKVFHLSTPATSYVIGIVDGVYLGHVYYGKKLEDLTGVYSLLRTEENPFTPSVNLREKVRFMETVPAEYSCGGTGDYREAGLGVLNAQGQYGCELHYKSYTIRPGKQALCGLPSVRGCESCCDTLEIVLEDPVLGLEAVLSYTAYRDMDAITRSVRIKNAGSDKLVLTRVLSAVLDQDQEDYEVITLHGSWGRERRIQRRKTGYGSVSAESLRGETGHQDQPFLAVMTPGTTQTSGSVYGMNLVYSGNFLAKVQTDQYDKMRAAMGIHPENFRWPLEPGEEFQAPECVLVYSDEGLGKMTRTFHDLYRDHLLPEKWKDRERPVLVNNWEATMMDFTTDVLLEFAQEAAKLGIDMLVMDDGWFGQRDNDDCGLGDWYINEKKLPGGLKRLSEEVNKLGLKFGIWIEPEMISEDSDLYRAHPDWAFQLKGRTPGNWRHQLVLDLTRDEVFEAVYGQIYASLSTGNIAYVKWDMNRPLCDVGNLVLPAGRQGEIAHRYVLAVYRMQQRLMEDFPDILFENCSSGGARFDPGMLSFSPQIWTSDDTDAIERLYIQEGTAICYPLSTMGAHVSVCPNMQTGRTVPFDTRALVAMAGTFGYELDVRHLSEEDRKAVPRQIALFRKVNPVVRTGDYYRIASNRENGYYDCWEVVKKDRSLAYMTFVQTLSQPNMPSRRIRLQGLDPDKMYAVSCDFCGARDFDGRALDERSFADCEENSGGAGIGTEIGTFQGRTLMNAGMLVPRAAGDYRAFLYELREV